MYSKSDTSIWTGRIDDEHNYSSFRYHQIVQVMTIDDAVKKQENYIALISFECDEGVRRNAGRVGAAQGPQSIKSMLASVPWRIADTALIDVGVVACEGTELEQAQQRLGDNVSRLLQKGIRLIIIGGGHETLYGHYLGVRASVGLDAKIGIINIDAHFDLRKFDEQPSSGTMFHQILAEDEHAKYMVLGIQQFSNTTELFERADQLGVNYVLEEDLVDMDNQEIDAMIADFIEQQDIVMLTLCMDVLAASAAPGVSAPSPFGLQPTFVRQLIRQVVKHDKVRSFDICEVNPALDIDQRTAKLAAYYVNEVVSVFTKYSRIRVFSL